MTENEEAGPAIPDPPKEPAWWEQVLAAAVFLGLVVLTVTTWPAVPRAAGKLLLGILEFFVVILSLMR